MTKSHPKLQKKDPSLDSVIDWNALLSFIASELDLCIWELKLCRKEIIEIQQEAFQRAGSGNLHRAISGVSA